MTSNEADAQNLIRAFFTALEAQRLETCATLLGELAALAQQLPAYRPWHAYFAGILANERDYDWAAAEQRFQQVVDSDADPALRSRALYALGRTYDYQGRWGEAIATFEQNLALAAQLGQPIEQAKSWKHIAITSQRGFAQGDLDAASLQHAISCCRQALELLNAITAPSPHIRWLIGSVWNTLGIIYMTLDQLDEAISCYQYDLDICKELDDQHGIGLSLHNLGEVYLRHGRASWPAALASYQQALQIVRSFDNRYDEIDILANLGFLHQEMGAYEAAYEHYHQAITLIEALRASVSTEAARAGFFATVVHTYAHMVLLCLAMGQPAEAFAYVERARARAFLDTLLARSPELAGQADATTVTLADVQAALPADALLLAYFTTGLLDADPSRGTQGAHRHRFPPERTLIFAVTSTTIRVHDAQFSPNLLLTGRLDNVIERYFLAPTVRRTFYDQFIAPVADLLPGRRWLYLAPHGPLHYIPFPALMTPEGVPLLSEDGPQPVYIPSVTFLLHSRAFEHTPAGLACLALGYNGDEGNRINFAEEEARSVALLADGHALSGAQPKKAAFIEIAGRYRILHISCHGLFDPLSPLDSALYLAPGEQLTALDVLQHLPLNCDLVVLSACESGLSRVRRGDELVGLARAFLLAGARMVICSLWRVDERSTRLLFERFYQELRGGATFAEALRQAQFYLRNLSSAEAREALLRIIADELLKPQPSVAPPVGGPSPVALPGSSRAYLKGTPAGNIASAADEEPVFVMPFYWAPFIVIGGHL